MISYEQYLRESAIDRRVIDVFLASDQASWAQFDSEVGYILGNALIPNGMDESLTISTSQANGARSALIYPTRSCRINTYGNSFTQCAQVNDGETWQEYLAAHLGEPIRNFGVGGFGVYQAYRRMLRAETTEDGAEYVILYLWGDDHLRSVMRCRHAAIYPRWDHRGGSAFHCNFWANIEMDLESGSFVEKENLLPTPDSLYRMTEPDFMVEALRDDLMLQLSAIQDVDPRSIDTAPLNALAEILGVAPIDEKKENSLEASAGQLKHAYGFAASRHIIEKTAEFCQENEKKLMICLLCPTALRQLLRSERRYDQTIVDYLRDREMLFFDMNNAHLKDYRNFRLSIDDYIKRYFIGHYNPAGNHLFAFSIKDLLVEWLDPKPVTYAKVNRLGIEEYTGYLPQ